MCGIAQLENLPESMEHKSSMADFNGLLQLNLFCRAYHNTRKIQLRPLCLDAEIPPMRILVL